MISRLTLTATVAALLASLAAAAPAATESRSVNAAGAAAPRPNIVLVLVDDMRRDDLAAMPATRRLVRQHGVDFTLAYAVTPLCCPSRASILTGQYPHNTGVLSNVFPTGGFAAFDDRPTIATWLDRAGYTTGYLGKYLNGYEEHPSYVPPGWDTWAATTDGTYEYEGSRTYNVNGLPQVKQGYASDVLSKLATQFIMANSGRVPFFLHVSYLAPHAAFQDRQWIPPVPAPRHADAFNGARLPVSASFNELDVTDKPAVIQRPLITARRINAMMRRHEARRESMLAVDDGVRMIVRRLRAESELDNTYLVFASDNGHFLGEHRYSLGKLLHYQAAAQVPLLMRGPSVPRNVERRQVVGLHDLASTFLGWAGAATPGKFPLDGRDLRPLIADRTAPTRRNLLIQALSENSAWRRYRAVRTPNWKYVEYVGGAVEMYDLINDPEELNNLAGRPRYADIQQRLRAELRNVRSCAGKGCR